MTNHPDLPRPTLDEMAKACEAASNGEAFDARAVRAASLTIGLIAEVPDAMRAILIAARDHPELKDPEFVETVLTHRRVLVECMNAAQPIMHILDAFPGASVREITDRNHAALDRYAWGLQDGGFAARAALGDRVWVDTPGKKPKEVDDDGTMSEQAEEAA